MKPEEVKAIRETLGLTIRAMARRTGVTTTTVFRWEHGECKPSPMALATLRKLRGKAQAQQERQQGQSA